VTQPEQPFDGGRPRPIVTSLDMVRPRIDLDGFDGAIFGLNAIAADLGFGDIRALPGALAWIDRLRSEGKRIGVTADTERAETALEIAQIADRVEVVVTGSCPRRRIAQALEQLDLAADRAAVISVHGEEVAAAITVGVELVIAVARGGDSPEELRRAGATTVLADLQELLGVASGQRN
jgi:beta-phosphoglucomutase-like phosphatase (HAD superfamily)